MVSETQLSLVGLAYQTLWLIGRRAPRFLFYGLVAALSSVGSASAPDVVYFGVVKSAQFQQTLASSPVPLASNAYTFTAFVVPTTNNAVTNASFKAPNVATNRWLTLSTNGNSLMFSETFQAQSALDAAYPSSGSILAPSVYRFTFGTLNDGTQTGNASYLLAATPPTPQIANLTDSQNIDTTADFTLRWSAMGGLVGVVQLLVQDVGSNIVCSSPTPFSAGALTQASTSWAIPAYTLPPATNLTGHLVFAQPGIPDTNSYRGATGLAALARDTAFPLVTRPPPVPPVLQITADSSSPAVVRFVAETNRNYHLQATTNLAVPVWVDLFVTNTTPAIFWDVESLVLPQRFYRVQVGP